MIPPQRARDDSLGYSSILEGEKNRVDNSTIHQARAIFAIPADLFEKFKTVLSREGTSIPKALGQFMLNYTKYLDKSFIKTKNLLKGKKSQVAILISDTISEKFTEKAEQDKIKPPMIIAQFMKNYVDFTNMNEKNH